MRFCGEGLGKKSYLCSKFSDTQIYDLLFQNTSAECDCHAGKP